MGAPAKPDSLAETEEVLFPNVVLLQWRSHSLIMATVATLTVASSCSLPRTARNYASKLITRPCSGGWHLWNVSGCIRTISSVARWSSWPFHAEAGGTQRNVHANESDVGCEQPADHRPLQHGGTSQAFCSGVPFISCRKPRQIRGLFRERGWTVSRSETTPMVTI